MTMNSNEILSMGFHKISFEEYQERALALAAYPMMGYNMVYPAMGLAGEAGEACDKVKKHWRNFSAENENKVNYTGMSGSSLNPQQCDDLVKEIGDVLWYVTALAHEIGSSLEEVARININKLESRHKRGTVLGEGDNRVNSNKGEYV